MTKIQEMEKEIALIKELLELRKELNQEYTEKDRVKDKIEFLNGGLISIPNYKESLFANGAMNPPTSICTSTASTQVAFNFTPKANANWPSSEDMWDGVQKPHYKEGCGISDGPCECEGYFNE